MKNEVYLRFCIWGYEDITSDEITRLTGVNPFKVYIKGKRKNLIGTALAEENGWIIAATDDKYAPFEEQMNSLLNILESNIDVFRSLCQKYFCEFSCALYVYTENGESTPGVHLDSRYNKLIKELNIEFDLDLYCFPNVSN